MFSLNDNSLSGNFHLPLCLNSTYWMDVSNNQLNGQLQGNIGNMLPNILSLKLSNNSLSGSLPSSIGNMSFLSIFSVSFNNFFGEVPKELLAGCSKLMIRNYLIIISMAIYCQVILTLLCYRL